MSDTSPGRLPRRGRAAACFSRKELLQWIASADDFGLRMRIAELLDALGPHAQATVQVTVVQEFGPPKRGRPGNELL